MKNPALITIISIVLVLGIIIFVASTTQISREIPNTNQNPSQPSPTPPQANPTPPEITPTPAQEQSQTHNIEINHGYSPKELTIKKGDTVIWTNVDTKTSHTITSTSGGELKSKFLKYGETYSHTFEKEGKFFYYCIPHDSEHGQVIVK